jgi:FAD:protein FMN transferase
MLGSGQVALLDHQVRFRAMGSECEIAVTGTHGTRSAEVLLQTAVELVETLESVWSRFRSESDTSNINRAAGKWTSVSRHTTNAVLLASAGRDHTNGRYNPLVGDDLHRIGYDRDFSELTTSVERSERFGPRPSVRGDIDVNEAQSSVRIPPNTQVDLGGIGKGYAGDLIVDALLALGATGVLANIGGDVRVAGESPQAGPWSIGVGERDEVVLLDDGAVAFTTTQRRTWMHNGQRVHHLIDPATGLSLGVELPMVCVVSSAGWWSEVLTKSIAVHIARSTNPMVAIESLDQFVPAGAHATVEVSNQVGNEVHSLDGSTREWDSVSARLVEMGR